MVDDFSEGDSEEDKADVMPEEVKHKHHEHHEESKHGHKEHHEVKEEHEHTEHHKLHEQGPREVKPYGRRKSIKKTILEIYDKRYKQLLIIPLILFILAVGQISYQIFSTTYYDAEGKLHIGDFINKGVTLKGGASITLNSEEVQIKSINLVELEKALSSQFPGVDISVREQSEFGERTGILVDATLEKKEDINKFKEILKTNVPGLTIELIESNIASIGSTLGEAFFKQTFRALIIAFIFMGIIVFIYFRLFVPSIAVILAAASDIIVTIAIVNLLGFKVGTAGIAAFLMLIGYSVDTDILLSTRVLKRKEGTVLDRVIGAFKTGIMMSLTTLVAIVIGLIFSQSPDLRQIMAILLIGLLIDIINTWIQNAGLLRWYLERKPQHGKI